MSYPMGDIPLSQGVCTDVIIRSLRDAYGIDLQELIYKDSQQRPYPGISKPDPSIDHRRVPNIVNFFKAHSLNVQNSPHQPGDIVVWKVEGLDHIGLISDLAPHSSPLVIHNIGRGVQEENFFAHNFPICHHFRLSEEFIKKFGKVSK